MVDDLMVVASLRPSHQPTANITTSGYSREVVQRIEERARLVRGCFAPAEPCQSFENAQRKTGAADTPAGKAHGRTIQGIKYGFQRSVANLANAFRKQYSLVGFDEFLPELMEGLSARLSVSLKMSLRYDQVTIGLL